MTTEKKPTYDVKSAEPILFSLDDGPDLSANQLARRAWIAGGMTVPPDAVPDRDITTVIDELVASGKYSTKAQE